MNDDLRKREKRVAVGHMGRTPFAAALTQAAMMAALAPGQPQVMLRRRDPQAQPPAAPPPTELPKTQRLRVIDDAGIENLNRSKAERARKNAKRLRDAERTAAGKARS